MAEERLLRWLRWLVPPEASSDSERRTGHSRYHGFTRSWLQGYRRIYAVRLTERVFQLARRRHVLLCPIALIAVGTWPALLNEVLALCAPRLATTAPNDWIWLVGLGLITSTMLFAAWSAWTFTFRGAATLDRLLERSPDRTRIEFVVLRWMRPRRQLVLPVFAVALSVVYLTLTDLGAHSTTDVSVASYLCAGWTVFFGANAAHWLYVVTGLARQTYLCRDLSLRWQDPASTPAVRLVSGAYGVASLLLLFGSLMILTLEFWLPGTLARRTTQILLDVFFLILVLLSFRVGPYAFWWIHAIIRREKQATLTLIQDQIPDLTKMASQGAETGDLGWLETYRIVSSARGLPFPSAVLAQYGAALFGTMVAFVINLFVGQS